MATHLVIGDTQHWLELCIQSGHLVIIPTRNNGLGVTINRKETVKVLLQYNLDVNAKKDDGYTALMLATRYSLKDVVKQLLSNGADTKARDYDLHGRSA